MVLYLSYTHKMTFGFFLRIKGFSLSSWQWINLVLNRDIYNFARMGI